jgi:hypothetical protein
MLWCVPCPHHSIIFSFFRIFCVIRHTKIYKALTYLKRKKHNKTIRVGKRAAVRRPAGDTTLIFSLKKRQSDLALTAFMLVGGLALSAMLFLHILHTLLLAFIASVIAMVQTEAFVENRFHQSIIPLVLPVQRL